MDATLTFLGTGTSMGIPTLGCDCEVCGSAVPNGPDDAPASPHNRRTRPSVLIAWEGHNVVIDTGPDFHAQAIRETRLFNRQIVVDGLQLQRQWNLLRRRP